MKVKIGVVGPQDSVDRIVGVANSFSEYKDLEIVSFPYAHTKEAVTIVKENRDQVDQWFFSGQAPYFYAKSKGLTEEVEISYPPLYGSSLLGSLLEMTLKEDQPFRKISLDTITAEEVAFISKAHNLEAFSFQTYSYTEYRESDKIVRFHQELNESGQCEVALTCLKEVYERLQDLGIPCYRIIPSQLAIKLVLRYMKERGESSKYRQSQIAIVGIEVIHSENSEEGQYYSYELKRDILDLKHMLLDEAEDLQGSFVQIGDGLYFIYTTRGEIESDLNDKTIFSQLSMIRTKSKIKVRIGIGYGITAVDAEQNVRLALQYARKEKDTVLVSVNEKREVQQFSEKEVGTSIEFKTRNWGEEWEKKFKDANISQSIVNKLHALSFHYKKDVVTVKDVAKWLKGTERNARRILGEMERLGLAKVSGMEQSGYAGRPSKVYQFLF